MCKLSAENRRSQVEGGELYGQFSVGDENALVWHGTQLHTDVWILNIKNTTC